MQRTIRSTASIMAIVAVLMAGGCARQTATNNQPQQRVAGTQEQASTVNATLTQSGLQLQQNQAPAGDITLRVDNQSDQAQTVTISGPNNLEQSTQSIQPGQTGTLALTDVQPGAYQVYVDGMQNEPDMRKTLTVSKAQGQAGAPNTMTMRIQNDRITVSPASIPANDMMLQVTNATDSAQTFVMAGQPEGRSYTLGPGETASMRVTRTGDRFVMQKPTGGTTNGTTTSPGAQRSTGRTTR